MSRAGAALVLCGLGVAVGAMTALHFVPSTLDPIAQPVSFYVHGVHGWLLPLAFGAFGVATVALGGMPTRTLTRRSRRAFVMFGAGMLMTAIVPSDLWFPWERTPTLHGVIHAAVAMLAPLLLLEPMLAFRRSSVGARALVIVYALGLAGSTASLATGFLGDEPPPMIGLAERVLALPAVAWVAVVAWREARGQR